MRIGPREVIIRLGPRPSIECRRVRARVPRRADGLAWLVLTTVDLGLVSRGGAGAGAGFVVRRVEVIMGRGPVGARDVGLASQAV